MEDPVSGYVLGRATVEIDSVAPLLSGLSLQGYVQGGLLSGWTSGFLSGYRATTASTTVTSGVFTLQLHPVAANDKHVRFLALFYENGMDKPITVWEFPAGAIVKENATGIRQWLFRR